MRVIKVEYCVAMVVLALVTGVRAQSEAAKAEKALLSMERDWAQALVKRDAQKMEGFLAREFVSVEPDGTVLDRAQYVEARVKDRELESSTLEQLRVRVFGQSATVTGLQTNQVRRGGEKVVERFRYVDVFVFQEGAWKCVSTQVTPMPGKK